MCDTQLAQVIKNLQPAAARQAADGRYARIWGHCAFMQPVAPEAAKLFLLLQVWASPATRTRYCPGASWTWLAAGSLGRHPWCRNRAAQGLTPQIS